MSKIAVLYGTTEGHTAKIAGHIAARGKAQGHEVHLQHIAELDEDFDVSDYDGVIVGASIHEGHHQQYVVRFLKARADELSRIPTAAFTVCLAIHSDDPNERQEAQSYAQQLIDETGVRFRASAVFAGALAYTQYSWLKRMVMKQIAAHEGGATDTSRDHDYTNYGQVDAFADHFYAQLASGSAGRELYA